MDSKKKPRLRSQDKRHLRTAGNPVKLAAGESSLGGLPEDVYRQRFQFFGIFDEPMIDVEQVDMNVHGFMNIRSKAAVQAPLGMAVAPHNFGSKLGFFAQVHLGMVTPNWDISEVDDSEYPALLAEGVVLNDGFGKLTGARGWSSLLDCCSCWSPRRSLSMPRFR